MPRQVLLGRLRARGDGLDFVAEPTREIVAAPGEEIELSVAYEYEEPTLAQDHFEATLRLHAAGVDPAPQARTVGDAPFSREREEGVLVKRLVVQGPTDVRFEVRAKLGHRPWTLRPATGDGAQLSETGTIRVRVS